jgi:hypothetical protein
MESGANHGEGLKTGSREDKASPGSVTDEPLNLAATRQKTIKVICFSFCRNSERVYHHGFLMEETKKQIGAKNMLPVNVANGRSWYEFCARWERFGRASGDRLRTIDLQ